MPPSVSYRGVVIEFAGGSFDLEADRVWASGPVAPGDFAALATMPGLRALNLNTADITDDDLELVGRLVGLHDLDVSTTGITDVGVRHLSGLTDMRHLRIKETRITDVGIGYLASMRRLETINVRGVEISDVGLRLLADHPYLDMVVLSDGLSAGRFTEAALADLQGRLPACEIVVVGRGTFPHL